MDEITAFYYIFTAAPCCTGFRKSRHLAYFSFTSLIFIKIVCIIIVIHRVILEFVT